MEKPWSQDYQCPSGHRFNLIIEHKEREVPVLCGCGGCEEMAGPVFSVPKNLRASYPDGTRRGGLRELAQAEQLRSEAWSLPADQRGDIQKEIVDLTKVRKT